jgi:hypothetical protein
MANRWTQKYSASLSARSHLILPRRKSAQIALRITICGTCLQRGASKAAWIFPTVSRWLGHKDGGALAMKTYGHLRREHSIAQAQRVTFSPVTTKQRISGNGMIRGATLPHEKEFFLRGGKRVAPPKGTPQTDTAPLLVSRKDHSYKNSFSKKPRKVVCTGFHRRLLRSENFTA